jgi:peptidyl-prolyl cis-trans isomerase B (cyclophilin B)
MKSRIYKFIGANNSGLYLFVQAFLICMLSMTLCLVLAACSTSGTSSTGSGKASVGSVSGGGDSGEVAAAVSSGNGGVSEPAGGKTIQQVKITMADGGEIVLELDSSQAPLTVANFIELANNGFYDGLIFHRIIPDFMIQGGDPKGTDRDGTAKNIKGEFSANGVNNTISHLRGVISMARSSEYDSASSQFFITNADSLFLDGNYAAFGHVISGMEVVDAISALPTDAKDRPIEPPVIKTIHSI